MRNHYDNDCCDSHFDNTPNCKPGCNPPPPPNSPCCVTPVPPPIKPLCLIPGMNVQEQMTTVVRKANECIERWNYIQCNCYEALNKCVGAAVSNNVYYDRDEVKLIDGYSEYDNAPYHYVRIKPCDKGGKPIRIRLNPAYGNTGNNGARQSMQDASFITSANAIITAIDPTNQTWNGPAIIDGEQVEGTPMDDTVPEGSVLYGFNRNGAMLCFPPQTTIDTLKQCRMRDVIGPGIQIVNQGEITAAAQTLVTASAIQAIGYKAGSGETIFFSCGHEDEMGMQGVNVAKVLVDMGVTTAVITCSQAAYPPSGATPYQGKREATTPAAVANQTKLGLTGGAMYLGRQLNAPLDWQMPYNQVFWLVTKKPQKGFRNDFTTEIADLTQSLGQNINNMANVNNSINDMRVDIEEATSLAQGLQDTVAEHDNEIKQLETDVSEIQGKIDGYDQRIAEVETKVDTVAKELEQNVSTLTTALGNETVARETADAQLQTQIDTLRQSDTNLIQAIENETNARKTADTQLDTKIDNEVAKLNKQIQDITIDAYSAGEGINISADRVISVDTSVLPDAEKVNELAQDVDTLQTGLLNANNRIDAIPSYKAGNNVNFTVEDDKIAINADLSSVQSQINQVNNTIAGINQVDATQNEQIKTLGETAENLEQNIKDLSEQIQDANITNGNGINITKLADGTKEISVKADSTITFNSDGTMHVEIPAPEQGEKVLPGTGINITKDGNEATISVDGTIATRSYVDSNVNYLQRQINENDKEAEENFATLDSNLTALHNHVADLESGESALPYVHLSGDTMTGDLTVQSGTNTTTPSEDGQPNTVTKDVTGSVQVGGTQFPTVTYTQGEKTVTASYSGGDVETINVNGEVSEIVLHSTSNNEGVCVSGLRKGQEGHDAVNVEQLQDVTGQLETKLDETKQDVATNTEKIAEQTGQITTINQTIQNIETGTTQLDYVKKTGDTMSGPLSLVDANGTVLGQLQLTQGGMMILGGSAASGAHVTLTDANVSVDKPVAVNGTVTAAAAGNDAQLATLGQVKAQTGNYLPLTGGTVTGLINQTGSGGAEWENIGYNNRNNARSGININGIWVTTITDHDIASPIPFQVSTPNRDNDATNKHYVDNKVNGYLPLTGGVITGDVYTNVQSDGYQKLGFNNTLNNLKSALIAANGLYGMTSLVADHSNKIPLIVGTPVASNHAATKEYVDSHSSSLELYGADYSLQVRGAIVASGRVRIYICGQFAYICGIDPIRENTTGTGIYQLLISTSATPDFKNILAYNFSVQGAVKAVPSYVAGTLLGNNYAFEIYYDQAISQTPQVINFGGAILFNG